MQRGHKRLEHYDATTLTYRSLQITDEDYAFQVTLEDGETCSWYDCGTTGFV